MEFPTFIAGFALGVATCVAYTALCTRGAAASRGDASKQPPVAVELPAGFRIGVRPSPRGCALYLERLTDRDVTEHASLEIWGMFEFEGACRELAKQAAEVVRCERLAADAIAELERGRRPNTSNASTPAR